MSRLIIILSLILSPLSLYAKKKVIYRKSQDVKFSGSDIDGVSRNPDGAYLQHRKSLKFIPLYKVKESFRSKIKSSIEYLR